MANLEASKNILKKLINKLENEISDQCIAKKADKTAIEDVLKQIDEAIMFEIGNMVNATEQADKDTIQAWVEEANKKSRDMLKRYKGRNSDIDEVLKDSEKTFSGNQSNTVMTEIEKAVEDNKEENAAQNGAYKREDFKTRYQKNEDAIKKSAEMMVKTKRLENVRGNTSQKQIMKNFKKVIGDYAGAGETFGQWQESIKNIDEVRNYDFSDKISTLLTRVAAINKTGNAIPERLVREFNELKSKLGKINFNVSGITKETKQAIKDILAFDDELQNKSASDVENALKAMENNILNVKTNALEIKDPKKAREAANKTFMNEIKNCRYFKEVFPEETHKIEDIIKSNKSMSEKKAELSPIFSQLKKELEETLQTSYEEEEKKNYQARLRRAELLNPEKAKVESCETAEKEHSDFKDIKEMADAEWKDLSDAVTDLETEVNALEVDKNDLEVEGNRLEAEVNTLESEKNTLKDRMVDLAMELAEDDEKQRQAAQAGPAATTVDPTKLDLEDLGFSKEFQLEKRLSGFNPTPVYHNFVTEGATTRTPGARQDSDSLVDEIYNQLKKESGFANVAGKLSGMNALQKIEKGNIFMRPFKGAVNVFKFLVNQGANFFKKEEPFVTVGQKQIEESLKKEIKKRIEALRDAHDAAQSAPVASADVLSEEDRLAKERAYDVAATEYESKQAEYEAKQAELINKANEYKTKNDAFIDKSNEYDAKRSEKAAQEGIYQEINDKYTARKKAFEDSLKVKTESDEKYQSNIKKTIYETVKNGGKVDAGSIKEEAEERDRD